MTVTSMISESAGCGGMPEFPSSRPVSSGSSNSGPELGRVFPAMRVDPRVPVRIAVARAQKGFLSSGDRWFEISGSLPSGSKIRELRGSVHCCRIADRPESCLDAAGVELWFREWKPDVLYFPRLEDLSFGILPVAWQEALRISLRHVLVNAVRPPTTIRERLLVREMMMATGGFWPGDPEGREVAPVLSLADGITWLVQGQQGAIELLRWKPRRAVNPRIMMVQGGSYEWGCSQFAAEWGPLLLAELPCGHPE